MLKGTELEAVVVLEQEQLLLVEVVLQDLYV
jgi:hypothetical protein